MSVVSIFLPFDKMCTFRTDMTINCKQNYSCIVEFLIKKGMPATIFSNQCAEFKSFKEFLSCNEMTRKLLDDWAPQTYLKWRTTPNISPHKTALTETTIRPVKTKLMA
jgi:hypothetical protein